MFEYGSILFKDLLAQVTNLMPLTLKFGKYRLRWFFTSQTTAAELSSMYRVPVAVIGFTDLGWSVKYPKRIKGILQVGLYPKN